jgi:hypothetical protein
MSERKNIDRLFQEKFKDFEAAPPEHVWKNIEAELKKEKEDRKVLPLWFKLSGIAAALFAGFLITDNVTDVDAPAVNNPIVIENNTTQDTVLRNNSDAVVSGNGGQSATASGNFSEQSTETVNGRQQLGKSPSSLDTDAAEFPQARQQLRTPSNRAANNIALAPFGKGKKAGTRRRQAATNSSVIEKNRESIAEISTNSEKSGSNAASSGNIALLPDEVQDTKQVASVAAEKKNTTSPDTAANNIASDTLNTNIAEVTADETIIDSAAIATVEPNALEELLNEKEDNVTTNEPKLNRWQLSSNVAPIYFSSTSNGSPIDPALAQNEKEYKQKLAYGLGVRYALNDKFTVRTGINTIGLEYSTSDVVFFQNTNARPLQHVNTNIQGSVIQIENKSDAALEMTPGANALAKFDANINQKTGYIEVPFELAYKVLDKKFGVEIIGGVSTLFLSENEISVISAGTEMEIGKANNLNNTHFSTNIGLGVKYNFLKSFQVNIEPTFKYQINTFTDSGNFKPYFFGLYTGVNYRF